MRITRLYHPEKLACGETIYLDKSASSHLVRVLRTKTGSPLVLFNGDGFNYQATTLDDNTKKTAVHIESRVAAENESSLSITLIQGLSRQDRMETTIQKSVELGVSKIIPVICQRSNTRLNADKQQKKLQHWHKVIISACEQSGRCVIPEITEINSLDNIMPLLSSTASKFMLDPDAANSLKDTAEHPAAVEILIGPEGGFSDEERDFLKDRGFNDIRFGPRILRTETAGPAVISAAQTLWGDF